MLSPVNCVSCNLSLSEAKNPKSQQTSLPSPYAPGPVRNEFLLHGSLRGKANGSNEAAR